LFMCGAKLITEIKSLPRSLRYGRGERPYHQNRQISQQIAHSLMFLTFLFTSTSSTRR